MLTVVCQIRRCLASQTLEDQALVWLQLLPTSPVAKSVILWRLNFDQLYGSHISLPWRCHVYKKILDLLMIIYVLQNISHVWIVLAENGVRFTIHHSNMQTKIKDAFILMCAQCDYVMHSPTVVSGEH